MDMPSAETGGEKMKTACGDYNKNAQLTMKEIIAKHNESNQRLIEKYCEKIQFQNRGLYKLKYRRKVYVEVYELLTKAMVPITPSLEKVTGIAILDHLRDKKPINTTYEDEVLTLLAEIEKQVQLGGKFILKKINNADKFPPATRKNAIYISFDNIFKVNNVNSPNHKQQILEQLQHLQSVEQQLAPRSKPSYERDMYLIDMIKAAEKCFSKTSL